MPDFRLQQNFPISSVIDAASRNAQLQAQSLQAGNESLIAGLKSIGDIGESLYNSKHRIAQSLAIGRQTGVPDELSRTMEPEQLLKLNEDNKWANRSLAQGIDPSAMQGMLSSLLGQKSAQTAQSPSGQNGVMPASGNMPNAAQNPNGAILASHMTATPMPDAPPNGPLPPAATGQMNMPGVQGMSPQGGALPVPIAAPPLKPKMMNPATFNAMIKMVGLARKNSPEQVMTPADALRAGSVPHGTRFVNPNSNPGGQSEAKLQDAYWREGVRGLQSIRGDQQVKDIETQRNAAINGYNRLSQIELEGKAPNPVDYVDIVGQIYKARTGTAPSEEILKQAVQETAAKQWGKAMTFLTGQQQPATTKDIAASLKDMIAHMGFQADDLHAGAMQVHGAEVLNPNMSPENVAKLAKLARGKSFSEATGAKPEDYDPHVQAIQWAQAHPNDPDAPAILKKAMEAKSQGGQIGL